MRPSIPRRCGTSSSWAQNRRVWPRLSTADGKASTSSSSSPRRPADRRARVPASRTTSVSRRHLRSGPRGSGVQPGPEVRGAGDGGQEGASPPLRAPAVLGRVRRRVDGPRRVDHHRHGGLLSEARRPGAEPATQRLAGCVAVDGQGYVRTSTDLSRDELRAAGWPRMRGPHHLETSLPGVFAVGDVRSGN
jgi:hypothetical protein